MKKFLFIYPSSSLIFQAILAGFLPSSPAQVAFYNKLFQQRPDFISFRLQ